MPVITPSGGTGGGSSGPTSDTFTLTTSATTFLGEHVFDLGASPHLVDLNIVAVSFVGDGETFGTGAGQLGMIDYTIGPSPGFLTSVDNVAYNIVTPITTGTGTQDVNGIMSSPGQNLQEILPSYRYFKVAVAVVDDASGALYAGANHPTATVRFDIIYR